MSEVLTSKLGRMGYQRARRLLVLAGLAVLAVVILIMYARRVDGVEVAATLLFVPIFLAFTYRGVIGGAIAAVCAIAVYAALRYPAIDAVGFSHFAGLTASRAAAYLIFGIFGGWSAQVLESSLDKLDLYDEIDDETGLYNARHLLRLTDLEVARAQRYRTLFSIALLDVPPTSLASLSARRRKHVLRELGRSLGEGARTVDHLAHVADGETHRFIAVLPETAPEGAEVFRLRFAEKVHRFLTERGPVFDQSDLVTRTLTFPGDEDRLVELREELTRIDASEHKTALPA